MEDNVDLFSELEEFIDLPTNLPLPDFPIFDNEVDELINGAYNEIGPSENPTNCEDSALVSPPNLGELLQNNQEFTTSMLQPFLAGLLGKKANTTSPIELIILSILLKKEPIPSGPKKIVVREVKIIRNSKCEESTSQTLLEKKQKI